MKSSRWALVLSLACLGTAVHGRLTLAQALSGAVAPIHVTPQQLHSILDSARIDGHLPALGAAIVTRDRVLMVDAVGMRRAGGTTPVTSEDEFHIGSDFKSMTAGWIAQQVDAGLRLIDLVQTGK